MPTTMPTTMPKTMSIQSTQWLRQLPSPTFSKLFKAKARGSRRSFLRCLSLLSAVCALACAQYGLAADANEFTAQRVVAFGDVHGANDALVELLQANKIIDDNLAWQAGSTHLVSVGDLLDRGPDSRATMDLLIRLQAEALAAGGRVHVVLGNHEALNLVGDLRYVSTAEYAAFATDPVPATAEPDATDGEQATDQPDGYLQHRAAFSPAGVYGKWLLGLPGIIKINRTLYAHGGLPPLVGKLGLDEMNASIRAGLLAAIDNQDPEAVLPPELTADGPLWYRGTAICHPLLEGANLTRVLAAVEADRVVIGHTPTASRHIEARLDDRVISIDTGMLQEYYRGAAFALEFSGTNVQMLSVDGSANALPWAHSMLLVPAAQEAQLADTLANAELSAAKSKSKIGGTPVSVTLGDGRTYEGTFVKASKRDVNNALAAWRIDRELELHMVPLTVKHKLGRRNGYVQFSPGRWLDESERVAKQLERPSYCATGHAYELVTAFDADTGADPRSATSLGYNTRTWALRLTDSHKTFSNKTQLPNYPVAPTLPAEFATRLEALSNGELAAIADELLTQPQQKALRARITQTLAWPISGLSTQSSPE